MSERSNQLRRERRVKKRARNKAARPPRKAEEAAGSRVEPVRLSRGLKAEQLAAALARHGVSSEVIRHGIGEGDGRPQWVVNWGAEYERLSDDERKALFEELESLRPET